MTGPFHNIPNSGVFCKGKQPVSIENPSRRKKGNKNGIRILGTGSYLPKTIVDNQAFTAIVDTSDEWIVKHSGIHTRHFTDGPTYEMALKAGEAALKNASLDPEGIDLILCTTVSGDYDTPSMACILQGLMGAKNAVAMDINAACAGFVYGLDMANMYLQHGYRRVLLISAESLSKITDFTDRSTCVLFGDGAGAAVLEGTDAPFYSVWAPTGPERVLFLPENLIIPILFWKSREQLPNATALLLVSRERSIWPASRYTNSL